MRGGPALAPAPDSEDGLSRGEEARSVARGRGSTNGERGAGTSTNQGAGGGQGLGKRLPNIYLQNPFSNMWVRNGLSDYFQFPLVKNLFRKKG